MSQLVNTVVTNILTALYEPFWFAIIMSVLFMFLYMYAYCTAETGKGIKRALAAWLKEFKRSVFFRRLLALTFYTSLVLFRTLLNRKLWLNPLSDVCGGWSLWTINGNGVRVLTTDSVENVLMLLPFTMLLMWAAKDKILKKVTFAGIVKSSFKTAFLFSLSVELLQLFLRVGTFQLSDLCYNTLGGIIGGVIYGAVWKIKSRKKMES